MCDVVRDLSGNLGRYVLGESLGPPGGYGAAFRAVCDGQTPCVVKLIHGFLNPTPQQIDRLLVMLETLALVESDHVVPIIDAGVDRTVAGALPWIAMPEISGAWSLRQAISASPHPLGDAAARRIGAGIARGLADLHAVHVLHRDLKPGNVLLDADGRPWLIDFELIKVLDLATRTSRAAEPLGTEVYMAPEQLLGPVVPQSDLWALGLVLLELLTGRQPVMAAARSRRDPHRVVLADHLVPDGLPGVWPELLHALLRKVPSARPLSAEVVVEWLATPKSGVLDGALVRTSPRWRWAAQSNDDVRAAERSATSGLHLACIDASGDAAQRARRLRRAAEAIGAPLAFEPGLADSGQLRLDDQSYATSSGQTDLERLVIDALSAQREAGGGHVLLPWKSVVEVGTANAVDVLRLGLRHRALAGNRSVIATVEIDNSALVSPIGSLELAAVLCALAPDGWRLLIDGLQPGCGARVLAAAIDMAAALASRADVWVRAGGLARWAFAPLSGMSVTLRSGRGLWTRPGGIPRRAAERVELPLLAGPVPRLIAERLSHAQPALVRCDCSVCRAASGGLPEQGAPTIMHNLAVVDAQLDSLQALPLGSRAEATVELLEAALHRRAAACELVGWDGELADLRDVLRVLQGDASTQKGLRLLRYA